jgi:hypothetical protein
VARGARRRLSHAADPLEAVRAFARGLGGEPWFAACGETLTETERADAAAYRAALGIAAAEIAGVAGWSQAAAILQQPDWSHAWWDGEAAAQQALTGEAERRHDRAALLAGLSAVAEAAASLHGAAALAMSRAGLADPALARVAAGAAAQACHQRALALAAGAGPEHLFAVKYRLFAAGRWPLGVVGDRCFVF